MRSLFTYLFLAVLYVVLLCSCQGIKHIPEGEKLYTGTKIKLTSQEKLRNKKDIKEAVEVTIRPKPNKKLLGMRPKIWFYYAAGDTSKNKFRKWVKTKLGEPPVLLSEVKPSETSKYIDARLFNIGIFNSLTTSQLKENKKTASVEYTSQVHNPYTIGKVKFPADSLYLLKVVASNADKTLLKEGDDYKLDVLKNERSRIDAVLKDSGYYYFNADYISFVGDTIKDTKVINIKLVLKPETPQRAIESYRIKNITVNPEYSLGDNRRREAIDTLVVDSIVFYNREYIIKPSVLLRSIYFRPYDKYSRRNHNITLNRLMSMGNYKFVNVKFTDADSSSNNLLNALIQLTPIPKRTFRSEINIVSKSNDFIGPHVNVNYKNRNTFNGAELLSLNLGGSLETQFSGSYKNTYSYEIGPQVELFFPKFIVPFRLKKTGSFYVPKTRISVGYDYIKRTDYFNLASLQFIFGYKWKETAKTEHELNPVNINYTAVSNKSDKFNELLNENPFLKKSYEEQFIAGLFYSYTFNEQVVPEQKNQFYLNTTAELSGNTLSLIKKTFYGEKPSPDDPSRFAGTVYSQFARGTIDVRNNFNFKKKNKIALRLYTGVGTPYGNSSTLPYIKQFFSGGANSLRAFIINSVGPGTYNRENNTDASFLQQGGDIKLEGNAEYRCNLFSIFKGAIFLDAGNVWLLKKNPAINSEPFAFNRFYNELALGTGVGLRLDASFFVIRLDIGIPLRKPWLEEGNRWVADEINFGSGSWRSDNMIFNLAIGYPF